MSRSGYDDFGCDGWDLIRWRGAVRSAIRGKRGQAFLRELREALDAMPEKRLLTEVVVCREGVCAMGAVAARRGIGPDHFKTGAWPPPLEERGRIDPEDRDAVARLLGIASALAAEIAYLNDEGTFRPETPEQRWVRMRTWVEAQITEEHAR